MNVKMPDGTIVQNVPDNITQSELMARYRNYVRPNQGNLAEGLGETALSLGSGAIATPVAGLAGLAATVIPGMSGADTVNKVQNALTYQPRTQEGKDITGAISYPFQKLAQGADWLGGKVAEETGSPALGAAVNTGVQAIPLIAGKVVGKAGDVKAPSMQDVAGAEAQKAGYTLLPSQARPTIINKFLEGFSGKLSAAQKASEKNQVVTNKLVRQAIGIPKDEPITTDALNNIRMQAGAAYRAVKESPDPIVATPEYLQKINALGGDFKTAAKEFPDLLKNDDIDNLISSLSIKQMSPTAAVELVKKLRIDATANLRAFDKPEKQALGFAQRAAADAVDGLVEQNLLKQGKPDLVKNYRQARQTIAKSYDIESALNDSTGNVSARFFGRLLDKKKPLTGELRDIAKFYKAFPKAAQNIEKIGSQPGISPLDYATGGMASLLSGHPGLLAAIAARPFIRSLIMSKPYQKAFVNPTAQRLGQTIIRGARNAQGNPITQMIEMGAENQ